MERAGYLPEDFEDEVFEVWPENWPAAHLFSRLGTQWSVGMGGATGLRYEAVYPLLNRAVVCTEEWDELFEDIRTLESAALAAMSKT